jgi:predicted secreted hydrolase
MNSKRLRIIFIVGIILTVVSAVVLLNRSATNASVQGFSASLTSYQDQPDGFARAEGVRPMDFPKDHGPHEDFQTEWWYYTGNLEYNEGRHFGYQLTFFRRAMVPPTTREERESTWASDQVYMAHFAITD